MIYRGTHYIREDEPCLNLAEVNLLAPDGKGRFRYEIIVVIRDDEPAEYRRKMGKASDFTASEVNIIGGVIDGNKIYAEETVGSLRDIAFTLREKPTMDKLEVPEHITWHDNKKRKIYK